MHAVRRGDGARPRVRPVRAVRARGRPAVPVAPSRSPGPCRRSDRTLRAAACKPSITYIFVQFWTIAHMLMDVGHLVTYADGASTCGASADRCGAASILSSTCTFRWPGPQTEVPGPPVESKSTELSRRLVETHRALLSRRSRTRPSIARGPDPELAIAECGNPP